MNCSTHNEKERNSLRNETTEYWKSLGFLVKTTVNPNWNIKQ